MMNLSFQYLHKLINKAMNMLVFNTKPSNNSFCKNVANNPSYLLDVGGRFLSICIYPRVCVC